MVAKTKNKPPIKTLTIINKPAVLCPFTKLYATLDRCKQCNNYIGFVNKDKSIECKWPY